LQTSGDEISLHIGNDKGCAPFSLDMQRRRLPNARPQAPTYEVAPREVIAVEHPAIIKNLDNALKSFGRNNPFERVSLC